MTVLFVTGRARPDAPQHERYAISGRARFFV